MKKLGIAAVAVALSGCVNYAQLQASAPNAASYELCKAGMMHGDQQVRSIAWNELRRRGEDCSKYAQAIAIERAGNAQAAAAYLANMPRPQAYQMPLPQQPVNCTSSTYGNQTYTNCR